MIDVENFFDCLTAGGIEFFTGIPDSLLKDFCFYVNQNVSREKHVISANEGSAVALAGGYYLATGKPALVYFQNSGLGNAVNPLLSFADADVYAIPMLLLIGWRGEPGIKDEPQHKKQGRVLKDMLDAMEIKFSIINKLTENHKAVIENACNYVREKNRPYAILVSQNTFSKYDSFDKPGNNYPLSREEAISMILSHIPKESIVVSTTGKISREVFEYRKRNKFSHDHDFLTVGSMGHCSQIALGLAMNSPDDEVYVLDGDGAVIMHMGALAISGTSRLNNYRHIVLNNGAHESVGGQPTIAFNIAMTEVAEACGYRTVQKSESKEELLRILPEFVNEGGPSFLEVRVSNKSREDLSRPDLSPIENKSGFMKYISSRKSS